MKIGKILGNKKIVMSKVVKEEKVKNPYSTLNILKKLAKKGDVVILKGNIMADDIVAKKGFVNKIKFLINLIRISNISCK